MLRVYYVRVYELVTASREMPTGVVHWAARVHPVVGHAGLRWQPKYRGTCTSLATEQPKNFRHNQNFQVRQRCLNKEETHCRDQQPHHAIGNVVGHPQEVVEVERVGVGSEQDGHPQWMTEVPVRAQQQPHRPSNSSKNISTVALAQQPNV